MARLILSLGAAVWLAACAGSTPHASTAASPDVPFVWGRYDLLPKSELDALLRVARKRLAVFAPGMTIQKVKVFSRTEVACFFGKDADSEPGDLSLERINGKWRVTHARRPSDEET